MTRDRKDLKIQALLEKISSLTTNYENQIADLRVTMTFEAENFQEQIKIAKEEIDRLQTELAKREVGEENIVPEVVEGDVVVLQKDDEEKA